MGITALDIKLRKSQRLTDFPDGGGRMVAEEVEDGQLNNLFPDISTQDRVAGRVSMRKAFVHVDTDSTDMLYGAVGVVIDPPEDDHVSMSMFSTGSYADTRTDARNRIENYITRGVESRYVLFGDHFIGQRSITVYTMQDAPSPEINETYCLSIERDGYPADVQYVRVEEVVSRTTQTFHHDQHTFERDVIVIAITTSLVHDFPGQEVFWRTDQKPPTRVRQTNVSDASSYYSIKPLLEPLELGATTVQVSDPYIHLVPTTQAETPVVDVLAGMGTTAYIAAGEPGSLTLSFSSSFAAGTPVLRFLGSPMCRDSVTVTVGSTTLTDNGQGELQAEGESQWSGTVDYMVGSVALMHANGASTSNVEITAQPAAPVLMQGFTDRIEITELNRQLNYVMQLVPFPYEGTVTVDYMSLGKWIRLTDNGMGQLSGRPGQGSGTVNYATGSLVVTLGALPDIHSAVIVSFGTGIVSERRDGDVALTATVPALQVQVPGTTEAPSVLPGTVAVEYKVGTEDVVATDEDTPGVLAVESTPVGTVDYSTRQIALAPAVMPNVAEPVTVLATVTTTESEAFTPALDGNGMANLALGDDVVPGSIKLIWTGNRLIGREPPSIDLHKIVQLVAQDDGNGNIVGKTVGGEQWGEIIGTVVYETGVVSVKINGNLANSISLPIYTRTFQSNVNMYSKVTYKVTSREQTGGIVSVVSGSPVNAVWQAESAPSVPIEVVYPPPGEPIPEPDPEEEPPPPIVLPPPPDPEDPPPDPEDPPPEPIPQPPPAVIDLGLDLTPGTDDPIVPGSVRFVYRGKTYVDRSGALYHSINPETNSGTYAGTIDYSTGHLDIVSWERGGANSIEVISLLVRHNEVGQQTIDFRTPGAPLRAGSFTLRATTLSGELLTATADLNGEITGDKIYGKIDWRTGAAQVRFGQMVLAAGHESEDWYEPEAVEDDMVYAPLLVNPATVYFGTVAYRNIPLNPELLGLDPVRLPEDGRVVVFRPGQTVLVHHTQETSVSPDAGEVVDLGRPHLTRVEVHDSAGTPVLSSWYTVDKTAGTVTFSDPLNLTGYELPIVIRDRIEDRVLVADAQITGEIGINRGLSHAYPEGGYLSTCLILGEANGSMDLQARVQGIFDQATWTGEFSDVLLGDAVDAQYNEVVYPILVDNGNAITERWALHFTNATTFEVIGESSGIIATGTTTSDCAPLNPRTGEPYFTVRKDGWGTGWSTGNVLRFNTIGGLAPVWFIRTTLAGEATAPYDGFRYETIGDAHP